MPGPRALTRRAERFAASSARSAAASSSSVGVPGVHCPTPSVGVSARSNDGVGEFKSCERSRAAIRLCLIPVGLREDRNEAVASVTPDRVEAAHACTHDAGGQREHRVAAQMTEVVVDGFEIVEIDDADREPKAIAGAAIDLAVELVTYPVVG